VIRLTEKQWRRLDVVERIERREMTIAEGAAALGISPRHMKRIRKRIVKEGAAAVVHGNAGRSPKHRITTLVRTRIVQLRRELYRGFNDQHFTEKLLEVEGLKISRSSVRRILREARVGPVHGRRAIKHRKRRDRKPQAGQMILWDGSRHDWLEGRGPRLCLMAAIDDATGELLPGGHFVEQECTVGYLRVLRELVKTKGIPLIAYMDRHGTLKRNDQRWSLEEQLAGRREPTQVKRALDDLGINVVYALSPQAKGRVERLWGTLQDRLVSELRLAEASTATEANAVLETYRPAHNKRFAIPAQEALQAWRPSPDAETVDSICALQHVRIVANNNSIRVGGQIIDIPRKARGRSYAKAYVTVRHLLDGRYRVFYGNEFIAETSGSPPTEATGQERSITVRDARLKKARTKRAEVTDSLNW
jgi:hypothetical protein